MNFRFARLVVPALAIFSLASCDNNAPTTQTPQASGSPSTVTKPRQADDIQFVRSQETPEAVAAMTRFSVCPVETIVSRPDDIPSPGDAANSFKVEKGTRYKFIAWAINKEKGTLPKDIKVALVGQSVYERAATVGLARTDVADYFKNPAFTNAGYQIEAAFDDVAAGDYKLFVIDPSANPASACQTQQTITVK